MKAKKVMAVLTAVCMSVSMAGVVSAAEENKSSRRLQRENWCSYEDNV